MLLAFVLSANKFAEFGETVFGTRILTVLTGLTYILPCGLRLRSMSAVLDWTGLLAAAV